MIGLYGTVFFTSGASPDAIKKSVSARWGAHELWRAKPMLEYAGPQLIELDFTMNFIKPFTNDPLGMVVMLEEIMDLAIPLPLILGLKPMGRGASLFVMTELEVQPKYFFQGGGFLGVAVNVKLKEYPDTLLSNLLSALGGVFGGSGSTTGAAGTAGTAGASTVDPTGSVTTGPLTQEPDAAPVIQDATTGGGINPDVTAPALPAATADAEQTGYNTDALALRVQQNYPAL